MISWCARENIVSFISWQLHMKSQLKIIIYFFIRADGTNVLQSLEYSSFTTAVGRCPFSQLASISREMMRFNQNWSRCVFFACVIFRLLSGVHLHKSVECICWIASNNKPIVMNKWSSMIDLMHHHHHQSAFARLVGHRRSDHVCRELRLFASIFNFHVLILYSFIRINCSQRSETSSYISSACEKMHGVLWLLLPIPV